jgi:hypothetical protein
VTAGAVDVRIHTDVRPCRSILVRALSTRKWKMHIGSVTHSPAAAAPPRRTPANVSGAALKAAAGDGDGPIDIKA